MTKAVSLSLGFILLLASAAALSAQTSPADLAVNEGVVRQANTIVLRQKLADAKSAAARGDLVAAAKYYEESYALTQQIGSGIDAETAQTVSGLVSTRMQLARQAQANGDLREADTQVKRVLKVDPKNQAAIAFKKQNDQMIAAMRGKIPDAQTLDQIPAIVNDKKDAATLVQDGKILYEAGKLEEATAKFNAALKLDPDNRGANYYLALTKQAMYARDSRAHDVVSADRMVEVERAWEKPKPNTSLPSPNPYANTNLVYTGTGRQAIINKLDRIRLDNVVFDALPLSEVVRYLSEQTRLRDPEKKGINFLVNPNGDTSIATTGPMAAGAGGGGFGGQPGAPAGVQPAFGGNPGGVAIDPATGLPVGQISAAGGNEPVDINTVVIKINPALTDVRLADVMDAICEVADHPIKYSIEDYAIVFSAKGAETPMLYSRHFRVDPNTFYQGLQSVSALSFGENNNSSSGGSGGSSGGSSGGGGGGSGGQNQGGAVVPVVNVAPGSSGLRSQGQGGGGTTGGGNTGGNNAAGGTGLLNNNGGNGGLNFVTTVNRTSDISQEARLFFSTLGVNLELPGKSLFFNDRLGELFVRGTQQDLDTIENAIEVLNRVAPQIHIKARFIEIDENNSSALGFDWYLGNYVNGKVIANGGSAPSLNVPVSSANPLGTFPGNTPASQIPGSASDQLLTGGLRNPLGAPALTTITGIMTDPNFRVVINALQQSTGAEELGEPEVVTTSGRQTEMRATQLISVVTGVNFQQGTSATTTGGTTTQ
jgi:tetratricopeptide (TPR) repeat protein